MKTTHQNLLKIITLFALLAYAGCASCDGVAEAPTDRDAGDGGTDAGRSDVRVEDASGRCEGACAECVVGSDGGFCSTKHCAVTVDPFTFRAPTRIFLHERSPSMAIAGDVVGQYICSLADPDRSASRDMELSMSYDEGDVPDGFQEDELVAIRVAGDEYSAVRDTIRDPVGDAVAIHVREGIDAAISAAPGRIRFDDEVGVETFDADDPAEVVRNLSHYSFRGAFFDGQRFYLANGPRVLIYENGVPDDPTASPDVVLGRPDLATDLDFTSASSYGEHAASIWSDGQRLAVSETNRVLLYNDVPTKNFAPADVVLGQDDFTSNALNRGGDVDATTLWNPETVFSDGTRFFVADTYNHRVLVWDSYPVIDDQPPDHVIGQENLRERTPAAGETPLYQPRGVWSDGRRLAVTSTFGASGALVFDAVPTSDNPAYDYVIGETNINSRVTPTHLESANAVSGFGDSGFAARDAYRVFVWNSFPTSNPSGPDLVLGKPDATVGGTFGRLTASSFSSADPSEIGVFADDTRVFVVDGRRVLVWKNLPTTRFSPADVVFGQGSFASSDEAIDYRGIGPDTLAYPAGVSTSAGVVAIADRANDRVLLIRGSDPTTANDVTVVGQPDATSFLPDLDFHSASASTLDGPTDVFTDGTRLVVADSGNHRVLVWDTLPASDGAPADRVFGQPDFASTRPNRGGSDADGDGDPDATSGSLYYPSGVFVDQDTLFVADTYNHRVLTFDLTSAQDGAVDVVGQPNFDSNEPNRGAG